MTPVKIYVFTTDNLSKKDKAFLYAKIHQLPPHFQKQILEYHNDELRLNKLCGKLLLQYGLTDSGSTETMKDITQNRFGKPMLKNTFFSLSYSENLVLCAIYPDGPIGIDVEKIKPVDVKDFRKAFTDHEWDSLKISGFSMEVFYRYWSIKESVLKAEGSGLFISPERIEVCDSRVILNGKEWYVTETEVEKNYICSLATEDKPHSICLSYLEVENLTRIK
jgi:4'-phosphopantetheinyl transferase